MAGPQQIGWSQESKLLWQLQQLAARLSGSGGGAGFESYASLAAFPPVGNASVIYLALDTNQIYYWDAIGTTYVEMSGAPASVAVYANIGLFPAVGTTGVIYIAENTDRIYYWDTIALAYVELSAGITSIGLSMPAAFTVSGSPLIANGSITVTGAGTTSQYVRGDGTLATYDITVYSYTEKTTTYNIAAGDSTINCTSGTFNVTLPTAVGVTGKVYVVKNSGAGVITINTTSSQTIDGNLSISIVTNEYMRLQSTGTNWIRI